MREAQHASPPPAEAPVVFGEILFDRFPGGEAVLGGAPLNVALHLAAFGRAPRVVSRVGPDAAGRRALAELARRGVATDAVQRDPERPTGAVLVRLVEGQPEFEILPGSAWDAIDADQALADCAGARPAVLYHGTLAAREEPARRALLALREALGAAVFVDVNLRPPWTPAARALELLRGAEWIKLNGAELEALCGVRCAADEQAAEHEARRLMERVGARRVLLTLGEEGARLYERDGPALAARAAPLPAEELVDAVGAGDALSAVALLAHLSGWPPQRMLEVGVAFAAAVCTVRGAVPDDPTFHERFLGAGGPR